MNSERTALQGRLLRLWYEQPSRLSALQPLSWLYGTAISARRAAYRQGWLRAQPVGKPVVVIGNLTVGGTGKTPLTIWLAKYLRQRGIDVGLVSRGYGRLDDGLRLVMSDSSWQEVGDEPVILHRRSGCATIVASDRVAGARELVARGAQVVLSDDGLQHLRMARQCEIVVVDSLRGFGNGRVLPAGPLRENVSRVQVADALVVNGGTEGEPVRGVPAEYAAAALRMRLVAAEARQVDGSGQPQPLEAFRGRPVHAVAGIGNPQRFFADLRARGLEIIEHPFPDHHALSAADLDFGDGLAVLMTEKDAVKCRQVAGPRLWYVPVEAAFSEGDSRRLLEIVTRAIDSFTSAGG
ncbi:MAG TPA: tetraacyldisaccharide 4'-kinase [Steroidobacteraceae bacterium]|nr:tetraacyldisaccharide 4'-kinase [Steroidobacteraceae bacterium]